MGHGGCFVPLIRTLPGRRECSILLRRRAATLVYRDASPGVFIAPHRLRRPARTPAGLTPAGVLFPQVASAKEKRMWDQYVADLHWAAKAVFGAACPVCGGGMTFVQVEPHPTTKAWNSTL